MHHSFLDLGQDSDFPKEQQSPQHHLIKKLVATPQKQRSPQK
jgi:hypothetical protein